MNPYNSYLHLVDDVAATAFQCSRRPEEITIVAISKGCSLKDLLLVHEAGCRYFGESRVQEALRKIALAPSDILWHLIGSLQLNKVSRSVENFHTIESIDSLRLAEKVSACALALETRISVFLQVKPSTEPLRKGFSEEGLLASWDQLIALPGISLDGLMIIAPLTNNQAENAKCFRQLNNLQQKLQQIAQAKVVPFLSMGMSHDYQIAIAEGATHLRIGRAIFGY